MEGKSELKPGERAGAQPPSPEKEGRGLGTGCSPAFLDSPRSHWVRLLGRDSWRIRVAPPAHPQAR